MKRFKWPLAPLLNIYQQQRQQALIDLGRLVTVDNANRARLNLLQQEENAVWHGQDYRFQRYINLQHLWQQQQQLHGQLQQRAAGIAQLRQHYIQQHKRWQTVSKMMAKQRRRYYSEQLRLLQLQQLDSLLHSAGD